MRRIASLSHSLCLSQRCLAMRLVCAPDGVVCRAFLSASRFFRSALVKCSVEDFREAESRQREMSDGACERFGDSD